MSPNPPPTPFPPYLNAEIEKLVSYDKDKRTEYKEIEDIAPYGVLFREPTCLDTPSKASNSNHSTLTAAETDDRNSCNSNLKHIRRVSLKKLHTIPIALSDIDALVASRTLPCQLTTNSPSARETRTTKRNRAYPKKLCPWEEFGRMVANHKPTALGQDEVGNPFHLCVMNTKSCRNETDESSYLTSNILSRLVGEDDWIRGPVGLPDICIGRINESGGYPALIIEVKSTQNLQLPEKEGKIIELYKKSWWIYHPIGQIACYMANNKCMYGVLTSATRTYFLHAACDNGSVQFFISRRWYVGEVHYLRAWAYVIDHARSCRSAELFTNERDWFDLTVVSENDKMRSSETSSTKVQELLPKMEETSSGTASSPEQVKERTLPPWEWKNMHGVREVPHNNVEPFWDQQLGSGRNGFVVRGEWRHDGQKHAVAIKQFDLDQGGGPRFERELEAYVALKDLQGSAVVPLLFISRSRCGRLRLMGMQLGQPVRGNEPMLEYEWKRVHAELKKAGWRQLHEEMKPENHVWLNRNRLVSVDLELLERYKSP